MNRETNTVQVHAPDGRSFVCLAAAYAVVEEALAIVGCFYLIIGAVDLVRVRWLESRSQRRERAEAIRSVQAVPTSSDAVEAEVAGESS